MSLNFRPVALIVLDGFGIAPAGKANAISLAKKPFFDSLVQTYPTHLLQASGMNVGLPEGEVGNSEVGHITIGSGILRYQSLPRVDKSISTGHFFKLPAIQQVIEKVKSSGCKLHFMGLVSNGGVHSSQEHLEALINFAKTAKIKDKVYIHAFLDGRDTAKDIGKSFMEKLLQYCKKEKVGEIASICGRFYAMDRNKNWDRIGAAYSAIVNGESGKVHNDPIKAIEESYAENVFDEEFVPTVMVDKKNRPIGTIDEGDVVIFFNYRADRARQLTQALVSPKFDKFQTKPLPNLNMITFTEYKKGLPVQVLFPPEVTKNPLGKVFSDYNLKQLHIAETEKYAHVTFFMNGTQEKAFAGEERILIPSPNVTSYDEKPEMSAAELTKNILKSVKADKHDFYVINYANPDMVGHTGNLEATVKAVETVDAALAKVVPAILKKGGSVFIVGDHGNAEELVNPITGATDKEHNNYPVPFISANSKLQGQPNPDLVGGDLSLVPPIGILADVAPTILSVAGLQVAPEMTGTCLV